MLVRAVWCCTGQVEGSNSCYSVCHCLTECTSLSPNFLCLFAMLRNQSAHKWSPEVNSLGLPAWRAGGESREKVCLNCGSFLLCPTCGIARRCALLQNLIATSRNELLEDTRQVCSS